jgi:hypothetical protein
MTVTINGTTGVTFPAGGLGNTAGAVVGTTDTQTLTNKTLTTPNINSAQVATVTGTAPIYMCRAWCQYNGSQAIVGSANITSITINATGDSTLAFTTAMPDATYSAVASTNEDSGTAKYCNVTQPSTASIRVITFNTAGTKVNNTYNFVAVFR